MSKKGYLTASKWTYKVLRSLILSVLITAVAIFVLLYVALSVPPVQNIIKDRIRTELTSLLGSRVEIGGLTIRPLNEAIVTDASFFDQEGKKCLEISRLGAGINLWRLIFRGEIEITYVELLDFKADIYQRAEGAPLNIDFIIKAFQPKDKNKPPTSFHLKIHNIVVRRGEVKFSRLWKPRKEDGEFDPNYIRVSGLSADVTIPRLSNEDIDIDLRRLSFSEQSGLQVRDIGGDFKVTPSEISVKEFSIRLPQTEIRLADFSIPKSLLTSGKTEGEVTLKIIDSTVTPSNLAAFYPPLSNIDTSFPLEATITGNGTYVNITNLQLGENTALYLTVDALITDFTSRSETDIDLRKFRLEIAPEYILSLLPVFPKNIDSVLLSGIGKAIGKAVVDITGRYNASTNGLQITTTLETAFGNLKISGNGRLDTDAFNGDIKVEIPSFHLAESLPHIPVEGLSEARVELEGHIPFKKPTYSNGVVSFSIGTLSLRNRTISDIRGEAAKADNDCSLSLAVNDYNLNGEIEASALLAGVDTHWTVDAVLNDFDTYSSFLSDDTRKGYEITGNLHAEAEGIRPDFLIGKLDIGNFSITNAEGKAINLKTLGLEISGTPEQDRKITLESEIADVEVKGDFYISRIPAMVKRTLGEVCPAIFDPYIGEADCGAASFAVSVKNAQPVIDFFNLPVFPLTEMTVDGNFDSVTDHIEIATEIPYIQQGKNNLITDTYLTIEIEGERGEATLLGGTVYPTKKGLLKLDLDLGGKNGVYDLKMDLNKGRDVMFYGNIDMRIMLDKNPLTGQLGVNAEFIPSILHLNDTDWSLEGSEIIYTGSDLAVRDFCVRHGDQYVLISGHSDREGEGTILLTLADVNVDYVFETLNINHVTFGGLASGRVIARNILNGNPEAFTEDFSIHEMSYNGAVLGDGDIEARLDMVDKMIAIAAKISERKKMVADVDGGVWFGRDSLSFKFKADSVNIAFMQPFMQAFSSDVQGRASGEALLYGTFSDIDMTGTLMAHDADIMIDYINARYHGSDTVYMHPGVIEVPHFKVYDKFGHSAMVNGELRHRYFHEPEFRFSISDMHNLLVYDTNAKSNPLWYGTIFASGAGEITGQPGSVNIAADVETRPGSDFTFVLSDQQEAVKSHFLTFTDRRKEAYEATLPKVEEPAFLQRFRKSSNNNEETSDIFTMDFRVSVNEDIRFNLVMDPIAGDKITAYGDGAMTLTYTSLTDELRLYGKYILDRGSYNFSLQDIILKDFTIKPGSSIAFTGDPYTGVLDITAAYKVNTSLTELDQSFANDRELNRTSVPIEALLKVTGVLTSPNIGFDIDLPTVTEETAQKVRSIISTDDMMSRQVLYLVALNKFYSPEYMSTSNSGGEWASIASSTISSQIQNVIGQLTDKFTFAPSIRSDKGDFSDIEVDLALSSQLFNNRLLINGNLGYRDPSNSSTAFVGDFDLEYKLNRKGTWRLKAYNHFNDQNYYLKSALTTQGIGIVWRKEFGKPKSEEEEKDEEAKKAEKEKEKEAKKAE